jgi:transcriptional regulator with XRE-family HTH domain
LAGLSVDYVVRLEQGRSVAPSVQVLTALSRALRLDDAERDHLFVLAGQAPPAPGKISAYIPPGVQRLVDQLAGAPLSVHDAAWNMLSWNPLWAALLGEPGAVFGSRRNIIWKHFAGPVENGSPIGSGRVIQTPEQKDRFMRAMVTDLRTSMARYPRDADLRSFVQELRDVSEPFAQLWDDRITGFHESDRKTIVHPELGEITLDCDVLAVPGSDLRIVVYTAAPGSEAAEKLRLLSVVGLQSLA